MDGSEAEGDLVLIQTFFALLWKLFLKNTSKHKNDLIYIIKQEGFYQSKVTLSLASTHNCKMAYSWTQNCRKSQILSLPKVLRLRREFQAKICYYGNYGYIPRFNFVYKLQCSSIFEENDKRPYEEFWY